MRRPLPAFSLLGAATLFIILSASDPAAALQRSPRGGGSRPAGDGTTSGRAAPKGGGNGGGTATPRVKGGSVSTPKSGDSGSPGATGATRERPAPTSGRSPEDGTAIAQAAPRTRGNSGGGTTIVIPNRYYGGFYPWGYGGYGFGGYYGGYYDPWFYGGYGYPRSSYSFSEDGELRIKVKPREATVFVDGYYAGRVDDFDGVFQRLRVEPGEHRIEIRADGYEPLEFDVRLEPGRTITYSGNLEPQP